MTQAWSLRETDLFGYQRKLDRIDEARVNGNFVDAEGQPADLHAQRVRFYIYTPLWSYAKLLLLDIVVSYSTQLRLHLRPSYFI